MNSNSRILLNIIEADHKARENHLEEFKSTGKEYTTFRSIGMAGIYFTTLLIGFGVFKSFKTVKRAKSVSYLPLGGLMISSFYLSTSFDYFLSENYFGKIMRHVKIDQDILDLIQEESEEHYNMLNDFKYR